MSTAGDTIVFNGRSIVRVMARMCAAIVVASIATQLVAHATGDHRLHGLVPLLYVDEERNIPSIFSGLILLVAAALLGVTAMVESRRATRDASRWVLLFAGFCLMSLDEVASLHELLAEPARALLSGHATGFFYYAWVAPGITVAGLVGAYMSGLLLRLPAPRRTRFVVAALLFLAGAIGMEMIGGRYAEMHGKHNLTYCILATIEESLEMSGVIVLIDALFKHLAAQSPQVALGFLYS